MNEHRRNKRKAADRAIEVTNAMTGTSVGRIGNLSIDGMMMIAYAPMRADALYQFAFKLPDGHGSAHPVEIGMHEQWTEQSGGAGQYWAGFRIIDLSPDDHQRITEWIERDEQY